MNIKVENLILPNKPLSNFELEDAVKKFKIQSFRGVFLIDTLPNKPQKNECGISNLDSSSGMGRDVGVEMKASILISSTCTHQLIYTITLVLMSFIQLNKFNQGKRSVVDIFVYTL